MSKQKNTSNPSIVTRDVAALSSKTDGNMYEAVVIISKRARQISQKIKEELSHKLADFATTMDNLEEVFENREQIEISKHYERMPKPTTLAIDEFIDNKLIFQRFHEVREIPKDDFMDE
ncbi:MAG: DNA-directed RNA polymerase subunit omega [Bernardetiaceae bacterium]|jgi:DNA-directed RNA polymerase subunit K/omega|nr:DNA-directed RNA polymerase subunit omega [Bernardetiaceae bacterium]